MKIKRRTGRRCGNCLHKGPHEDFIPGTVDGGTVCLSCYEKEISLDNKQIKYNAKTRSCLNCDRLFKSYNNKRRCNDCLYAHKDADEDYTLLVSMRR